MTAKQIKSMLQSKNNEMTNDILLEVYDTQFKQYHIVSIIDSVMNYISVNQYISEEQAFKLFQQDLLLTKTYDIIKDSICKWNIINADETQKVNNTEKLKKAKGQIEDKVKTLVALNDEIDLFESVLEKHRSKHMVDDFYEEDLAKDMVSFAFKEKDKLIITSKMKELLKILPVRMATDKWYEYIQHSLNIYLGAYKKDLEQFIQSIKETYDPELVTGYKDITIDINVINDLKQVNFKLLSDSDIDDYLLKLKKLSKSIEIIFDICSSFTEIINRLIILSIGPSYKITDLYDIEPKIVNLVSIIEYIKERKKIIEEDIYGYLTELEGVVEDRFIEIDSLESIVNMILQDKTELLKGSNLSIKYDEITIAKMLLSTSLFANIDEVSNETSIQVDKSMLTESVEDLIRYMRKHKDKFPREVRRGKINQLLYMLPVIFKSPQEFYDYVLHSLVSCSNKNEKGIVYNKYKDIQREYM